MPRQARGYRGRTYYREAEGLRGKELEGRVAIAVLGYNLLVSLLDVFAEQVG
jgi:hypothetical protein